MMKIPYLKEEQGKKILMVHEEPFIMLSGEVHNSSSSSATYMEKVWDKAENLGLNSILLPVTWEMVEPQEGEFDFSLVDSLIEQARERGKRLGFLWFGAWKNAQCYYAPAWVKKDTDRFKRAQVVKGQNFTYLKDFHGMSYSTLSYLCEATNEADSKAFQAFMSHLKEVDEKENTVVMVQVENECGLQGSARENSIEADFLFEAEVPQHFVDYMKSCTSSMAEDVRISVEGGANKGSWKEVFGENAEEIFSAYHVAAYVNRVAKAGKDVYPLPMAANCWLDKGQKAGMYPSGGPVARMMEVWKYVAPSIDIIAPDIYVSNFCGICDEYVKLNNPLFIPETATHSYAGPRQVYVVGHYHALGFAPFGFEDMGEAFSAMDSYLFGVDTSDPAVRTPQNVEEYRWFTTTLNNLMPELTKKYGTNDLQAVSVERKENDTMLFGEYGFKIMMDLPILSRKDGVCLILKVAEDEFYIIANGCAVIPFSSNQQMPFVGIDSLEDGEFKDGVWNMHRRLNGDEVAIMRYEEPTLLKLKLYHYN
jgi:beta-galactosidase GanA